MCDSGLLAGLYLWIFETEVAHVVVDESVRETPVHERQAPLETKSD